MNKLKIEVENRKLRNLIRPSNRKTGCLKFYANEGTNHKYHKFLVFNLLLENGWEVYSEAIFKSGSRCDILGIKEGQGIIVEILSTEEVKECQEKIKMYPKDLRVYMVKELSDITKIPTQI